MQDENFNMQDNSDQQHNPEPKTKDSVQENEPIQTDGFNTQPTYSTIPPRYEPTNTYTQPVYTPPQISKKKKSNPWAVVSIICIILTIASISLASISLIRSTNKNTPTAQYTQTPNINQNGTPDYTPENGETNEEGLQKLDTTQVIKKVEPSTVEIIASNTSSASAGSGVIMTEDGYVLTNAHVIAGATSLSVITTDGQQHNAVVIGYDTDSDTGVIKMDGTFTAASFGDSSKLVQGEEVIAIGTPYSPDLYNTCTKGIVSGIRNNLSFNSIGLTLNVIQHDAAINSGNSGGPLVNMYGQVIGINSVKISGVYEGLCFSIQINDMLETAKQLIANGTVEKPVLGIKGGTAQAIGGVYIAEVTAGGAAEEAGMQVGDVITKADDTRMNTMEDLSSYIKSKNIGDTITFSIIRNGEQINITATLKSSLA